jgi:hypothetical protein
VVDGLRPTTPGPPGGHDGAIAAWIWRSLDARPRYDRGRPPSLLQNAGEFTESLQNAAVDLRLEGVAEPVAAVNELATRFSDFRWHREGTRRPAATEEDWRVPREASQAIAAIRERLESQLPAILDEILPVSRGWRWPWSGAATQPSQ